MHDFCICADNIVESKVSAILLKHPGINCYGSNAISVRMFTSVSSEQEPLVYLRTLRNRLLQLFILIVCNTLFAGATVRHL